MNCQNCGGPLRPVDRRNYLHCGFCGTSVFPSPLEDSADRIIPLNETTETCCPACDELLHVGAMDGARVQYCESCRGILIASDVFGHLVRKRRAEHKGPDDRPVPLNPEELAQIQACPLCGRDMDVHPYHGPGNVVIDSCGPCRTVWLDHGEMAAIERAPGRRY